MENFSNPNPNNNNLLGNQNSYSNNNLSNNMSNSQNDSRNNNFSNSSPTDNQNNSPENLRQDNDNNWPSNYPNNSNNNGPSNYPPDNQINSPKEMQQDNNNNWPSNYPDNSYNNYPSNNNSENITPKHDRFRTNSNSKHAEDTTPSESTTNHRILLHFKKNEYRIFQINLSDYKKGENENGFVLFSREYHFSWSENSDNLSNQIPLIQSYSSCSDPLSSLTISLDNSCEDCIDSELRLRNLQHIYLSHFYKKNPTNFNSELIRSQIDCYKVNQNFTLAHFNGFSFDDFEYNPIPTVLTDRPVNGPLSSLFEEVKSNNVQNNYTFNLNEFDSITAEQKFALICGIANGVGFIHKNGFIHSNLSPKTIYIDENIHPKICDYIFIPSFNVAIGKEEVDDDDDEDEENDEDEDESIEKNPFNYSYKSRPSFENNRYIAPEVLNCQEFNWSSDIFSLGLIIFFIICEFEAEIDKEGQIMNFPPNLSGIWRELINECTDKNPSKRPRAKKILKKLLADNEKKLSFLSSIEPDSPCNSEISLRNDLYLRRILSGIGKKFSDEIEFPIFHQMVPNISEIDEETRMIIQAAEYGDVERLEEVGDFFLKGKKNLYQDENWSFLCYEEAAKRGSTKSMLIVSKFYEEGVGTSKNLKKAYEILQNIIKTVENWSEIDEKMEEIEEKRKTIVLINIPLETTTDEIKEIIKKPKNSRENYEFTIQQIKEEKTQKMILKFKEIKNACRVNLELSKKNYKLNGKPIESELKHSLIESHRFKSLESALPIINLDDYCISKKNDKFILLGQGSYASTYLVHSKKDKKKIFAAKIYQNSLVYNVMINSLKREIIMASKFNHPAILKYLGFNEHSLKENSQKIKSKNIYPTFLMEYIPNGNLEDVIKKKPSGWNNTAKLKAIVGISSALAKMFLLEIVHRDLKPENILMNEKFEPIICDFGCSRQYFSNTHSKMTGHIGTPIYMAPELFNNEFLPEYTYEVDSYAFGIIMYQILTDTKMLDVYPHGTSHASIIGIKLNNYVPSLPDDMNQLFKSLIESCWNVSYNSRPDPPCIYKKLVDAIETSKDELLPDVDIESVKSYIRTLPDIYFS